MRRCRFLLTLALVAGWVAPAPAGIIFNKHGKPDAASRVPALVMTLKTDPNEKKRTAAAQELRNFDPGAFPEIVPVLIEAAQGDAKAGVRMEALTSLGKLRPVSPQVGQTLEQVMDKDASWRVRVHARSVLVHYHLSGYRSGKGLEGPALGTGEGPALGLKTGEPPLADPPVEAPKAVAPPPAAPRLTPVPQPSRVAPPAKAQGPRPLPVGPVVEAPVLVPPPSSATASGPDLGAPK